MTTKVITRRPYDPQRIYTEPFTFSEETKTHQSFKDECDINNIMARYEKTGYLPGNPDRIPRYEDLTGAVDYHAALNMIHEAEDAFMALPARVRERFQNDPAEYLAAIEEAHAPGNDALRDELGELGILIPAEKSPEPEPSQASGEPPAPTSDP